MKDVLRGVLPVRTAKPGQCRRRLRIRWLKAVINTEKKKVFPDWIWITEMEVRISSLSRSM